ncbi:hypothetical protein TNCV_146611 [Trichonephila clavipes]|nr:hypothetical protein TNCV_146611 [Trichonephila clavipes]
MFSVQRHSCAYCDKPIQWPKIVNVTLLSPQKTLPPLQQRRKTFRERRSLEMRKIESLEVRTKFPKKIPLTSDPKLRRSADSLGTDGSEQNLVKSSFYGPLDARPKRSTDRPALIVAHRIHSGVDGNC